MNIIKLKLNGTYEIRPQMIGDMRGYFAETYRAEVFAEKGLQTVWVQENQSLSTEKGTIRGLHFQQSPHAQTKLVRAALGRILDVFVDLRKDSPTYGRWDSIVLSDESGNAVYVPKGFAHGFCTLTENSLVQYKVDDYYSPESETGIRWNDPDLKIEWPLADPHLSARDLTLPLFGDLINPFE